MVRSRRPAAASRAHGFDAFDAFSDWFNIILVFAAFAGMALALVGSGSERLPVSLSVVDDGARRHRHDHPADLHHQPARTPRRFGEAAPEVDLDREFGVFLGLIELVALTVGGYMTMQEEGVSFGGAADRLSDSGAQQPRSSQQPPPPPPAQPPRQAPPPPPPQQPARRRSS